MVVVVVGRWFLVGGVFVADAVVIGCRLLLAVVSC